MKTVCIDAGHGGRDPGCVSFDGVKESAIVLDVCQRIRAAISGAVRVVMTRDDNTFIGLSLRAEISNRERSDAFLSVHCNSASNRQAQGWELFTSVGETQADRLAQSVASFHSERFPDQKNRGLKEVNFSVLRRTAAPAVLVELGFLSNAQEAAWLETEQVRQGMADCIAAGVLEFLGVSAEPTLTIEQRLERIEQYLNLT